MSGNRRITGGQGAEDSAKDRRNLGLKLRQFRRERGLSLAEAAAADISPSFLSHVETGKGNITFLRLHRLVRAYGANVMDVLPYPDSKSDVVQAKERSPLRSSTEGISMYLLAPDSHRTMKPVLGILEPGAAEADFGQHDNDNFIYVVKGALKIIFKGGREVKLKRGDSIYLESREGRKSANASSGTTITLGVTVWRRP
jgi:transcriptional regulator with XRE-family HTH domain